MPHAHIEPRLESGSLLVTVVDGEIILDCDGSAAPSLTPDAARKTAEKLIEAADRAERT